jgi:hypothetical protein
MYDSDSGRTVWPFVGAAAAVATIAARSRSLAFMKASWVKE